MDQYKYGTIVEHGGLKYQVIEQRGEYLIVERLGLDARDTNRLIKILAAKVERRIEMATLADKDLARRR